MSLDEDIARVAELIYQKGDMPSAETLALELLEIHPKSYKLIAMYGQTLASMLQPDKARLQYMKALKLQPKSPEVLELMAELGLNNGQYRQAIDYADKALKYNPKSLSAMSTKTNTYLRMKKPEQARKFLDGMPDLVPRSVMLSTQYARVLIDLDEPQEAANRLQPFLDKDMLPARMIAMLFTLGQAYQKLKKYNDAFAIYERANLMSAGRFDSASYDSWTDYQISFFTPEQMKAIPRVDLDASHITLIVGLPRCGSTLTEQIIQTHPQSYGAGESKGWLLAHNTIQTFGFDQEWPDCIKLMTSEHLQKMSRVYLDEVSRMAGNASLILDKQLTNHQYLGFLSALLPGVKIIHCTRHPMDLGLSCWTNRFPPGSVAWADTLEDIGKAWLRYEKIMAHWKSLSIPILDVRYEDLVQNTESISKKILEYSGLPWDPACLRFWESKRKVLTLSSKQVDKPIYQSSRGRHQEWGNLLNPLRNALGEAIERYENP